MANHPVWLVIKAILIILILQFSGSPYSQEVFIYQSDPATTRAIESVALQNSSKSRIFYVSPDGSDSASGSAENPWRTIQHAVDMLFAGDKIVIRDGVYNEQVYITNDGDTWSDYITITAYPGEKPVIVGGGLTTEENGVVIAASRVRLMGLEVANWEGNGIWIEGSHHVEISNCTVRDVGYGIGVADGSHDFVFMNVEAHNSYSMDLMSLRQVETIVTTVSS